MEEYRHCCYILRCADGTFYTGYTTDLEKRLRAHNAGKGAKYTRARRPCVLVHQERFATKTEAMRREYEIKHRYTRQQKEALARD